jgi:tetratricopeptide (TPR) repeat protein
MAGLRKFMVVEDNDATMLFFSMALQDVGVKDAIQARTVDDALAKYKELSPNYLIVSWELKTCPGTFLIQKLKALTKIKHVPFILYSKRLSPEDLVLLKEMGMDNILALPLAKEKASQEILAMIKKEEEMPPEEITLRKIEAALKEQKPADALKYFDESLKKKGPYYVRAQVLLGEIFIQTHDIPKAEQAYKAALGENPNSYDALSGLANVYSRLEQHEKALKILTDLSQKSPKNINTMVNLGATYVQANRLTEAKQTFSKISSIDPDAPGLKEEQSKAAFKEGDMGLAAKLIAETQQGDQLARYFNNLAISQSRRNDFNKAIETYQNAIKILVNKAKLYALRYNLGLAYVKKGDLQKGFVELAASFKEDPSFEKAYAALVKCTKDMQAKGLTPDPQLVRDIKALRRPSGSGKPKKAS